MSIQNGLINSLSSLQSSISNITDNDGVSIGKSAGETNQALYSIAIGNSAGQTDQGTSSVAIGSYAGQTDQSDSCVAIGGLSGKTSQGTRAISIGLYSAQNSQGSDSIAIGSSSGETTQNTNAIAIGTYAGNNNQGSQSIAIGHQAGYTTQQTSAIAVGDGAGRTNQGTNSIAIGKNAGYLDQVNNSIILNATGVALNNTDQGLFIKPISASTDITNVLVYDTVTSKITYNTTKTFVINHPIDENKYLVHACLEGPEAGIYYRGKGTITNNESVQITLPEYVKHIGSNYTINITRIYSGKKTNETYETSEIENNSFTVYGTNGSFYWIVYAERLKIETEPDKKDVELKGDGPYTYLI